MSQDKPTSQDPAPTVGQNGKAPEFDQLARSHRGGGDHFDKGGYQPKEGYSPLDKRGYIPVTLSPVVPPLPTSGSAQSAKPESSQKADKQ